MALYATSYLIILAVSLLFLYLWKIPIEAESPRIHKGLILIFVGVASWGVSATFITLQMICALCFGGLLGAIEYKYEFFYLVMLLHISNE